MSIIAEFTIPASEFVFGDVFTDAPDATIELERIVPASDSLMPYFWVTCEDHKTVERAVRNHPAARNVTRLDSVDDQTLYRTVWEDDVHDLIYGIGQTEGVILEASGDERWFFRLRFPNHDTLARFYNFCTEHEISLHIERVYTLTEHVEEGRQLGLTADQREALVLGLDRGYFDSPSEASLSDLGEELGITQQAMSKRIRGGMKRVLTKVLLDSTDQPPRE
ncbi:helix-turn-helix domain-containing protein [Halostagnicola sp. A-GB9-2]|uniref:bacterio-opsin activator domain-containing protein n=1 Tax=Halostagnicola sp. A-GB9-2 TaxID=3048066 RepID=UPI0024C010D9|nr:helix-turn-helix domain-containing protein [Halostagnicola sp. A-GB9-2]MDJ1431184.1 helix-turn-helix domain-containing protein [Halostagnicola sp. A-GB9-2]